MKQACVEAIAQTLGRQPKADELKGIEDRIKEAVRQVHKKNAREGKAGIPDAQTYMEAADLVRQRVVHDVYKKRQRVAQNAIAISRVTDTLDASIPPEQQTPANLQQFIFAGRKTKIFGNDPDINVTSAEELATGAYQDWSRQLSAELLKAGDDVRKFFEQSKALGEQRFRSLFDQQAAKSAQFQILKELYGEDTGNPQAKKIAQVWNDVTNRARQEMNDNGFDIGLRDDWHLPYVDDADFIRNAGRDEWLASLPVAEQAKARLSGRQPPIEFARQAWVDDVYNTQDRSNYVNPDGSPMNDIEYRQALEAIFETKATDGANKIDPGAFMGTGGIKNRGSQSRVMAFKDAQSHFAYMERYTQQPVAGVMMSHLQSSSRDLGVVKAFGPDAARNFSLVLDRVYQRAVTGGKAVGHMNEERKMVERMFNSMAGLNGAATSSVFTSAVGGLRNLMTSAMLGTSVLTATSDQAIMRANAQALGFTRDGMRLSANTIKNLFSGDAKRANAELGLLVDSHAAVVSKMGGFDLSRGITGWFAEKTLKWSGLIAMDRANKAAFGLLMYKNIGELTRKFKTLDDVKGSDKTILANKGWSNEDWAIMAAADLQPMTTSGHMGMTPDAIYAVPNDVITGIMADRIAQVRAGSEEALEALGDLPPERLKRMKEAFDAEAEQTITRMVRNARAEAAQKLLGITHGEMTSAVTTATGLDTYARDDAGQLIKSFMLFKTTPFAGFRQLVNRANDLDTVPALKFLASYIAGTTLAGMFANQMNSLLTGNDPLDMTKPTTWVQALLKGGSFGIYGDFLFQDHTQYGSSIAATIGGPVLSFAEQLTKLLITNPQKALQGEETSFGADALKTARMITPFANLWYAKAITNHLILQQLQEMANPGYNDRVRDRAQREFNTTSWWEPGAITPRRAPDLGKAVGN